MADIDLLDKRLKELVAEWKVIPPWPSAHEIQQAMREVVAYNQNLKYATSLEILDAAMKRLWSLVVL